MTQRELTPCAPRPPPPQDAPTYAAIYAADAADVPPMYPRSNAPAAVPPAPQSRPARNPPTKSAAAAAPRPSKYPPAVPQAQAAQHIKTIANQNYSKNRLHNLHIAPPSQIIPANTLIIPPLPPTSRTTTTPNNHKINMYGINTLARYVNKNIKKWPI
jgi:hypothetical protein